MSFIVGRHSCVNLSVVKDFEKHRLIGVLIFMQKVESLSIQRHPVVVLHINLPRDFDLRIKAHTHTDFRSLDLGGLQLLLFVIDGALGFLPDQFVGFDVTEVNNLIPGQDIALPSN